MTIRSVTTMSVLALLSACSSQPGSSAVNATAQAHNAFRAGNIAAAESAYDAALAANPKDASALVGLGEVYEKTGRKSEAIKLYTRARDQRSGAIRVWNDGRVMQDGITEIATRRLSVLGYQKKAIAKSPKPKKPKAKPVLQATKPIVTPEPIVPIAVVHHQPAAPVTVESQPQAPLITTTPIQTIAPLVAVQEPQDVFTTAIIAPQPIPYTSENSAYSLDSEGVVYYTDPEATQPLTRHSTGTVYFSDPEATQPITTFVSELPTAQNQRPSLSTTTPQPALATTAITPPTSEITPLPAYLATTPLAPIHVEVPTQADIATYQANPIAYESAPAPSVQPSVPAIKPVRQIAPTVPSSTTPAPTVTRKSTASLLSQPLPRSQPGYAVIEGDLVYISAEDIANGAIGRPVADPVISDPLNGTRIPNLN